jgi:hypothetical protein
MNHKRKYNTLSDCDTFDGRLEGPFEAIMSNEPSQKRYRPYHEYEQKTLTLRALPPLYNSPITQEQRTTNLRYTQHKSYRKLLEEGAAFDFVICLSRNDEIETSVPVHRKLMSQFIPSIFNETSQHMHGGPTNALMLDANLLDNVQSHHIVMLVEFVYDLEIKSVSKYDDLIALLVLADFLLVSTCITFTTSLSDFQSHRKLF